MGSPEAAGGGGLLHSLSAVVQFLHAEGFLGAEEALLREIENKYARDAATASPASSREGGGDSGGGVAPLPQVDLQPALAAVQSVPPLESMESAEK